MEYSGFTVHGHIPYPIARKRIEDILKAGLSPDIYISGDELDKGIDISFLKRIKEGCRTISFHGPFNEMCPGGVDEAFRLLTVKRINQILDIAEEVRPEAIVFHAGYEGKRYDWEWEVWLEQSKKTWGGLAKRIKDIGIVVALENVFEENPLPIKTLLSYMAHPNLRFCLDSSHATVFSDIPCHQWLEEMHPYLSVMHLHNTRNNKRDEHNAIFDGIIDFKQILNRIKEVGIHPLLIIEAHNEEDLKESIRELETFLEVTYGQGTAGL